MYHLLIALLFAFAPATSLLDLDGMVTPSGLPDGWEVRPVKGQSAPDYRVLETEDGRRALRVSGQGAAAWATRKLPQPIPPGAGRLRWSWRVLELPQAADLRVQRVDDSALRVYVVFGNPGKLFNSSGRIVFYSWGNAEPEGLTMPSHVSDPFADYRRLWNREPPPITAVGLMQDTDMTHSMAVAEFRDLTWTPQP